MGSRKQEVRITENNNTVNGGAKLSKMQYVKQQQKKEKTKKLITAIASIAIVVGILAGVLALVLSKSPDMDRVAATSESWDDITVAEVAYLMRDYINQNYFYLVYYYGFNPQLSLKAQYVSGSSTTWFTYLLNNAKNQLNELVALASEAKKQGMTLDEKDIKNIDDSMDSLKASAKEAGYYNVNKYLEDVYGKGVDKGVVRKCWELQQLASKYYQKLVESYEYSDEDYAKYVEENRESFYTYDYIYYQFNPETKTGATEDEKKAFLEAAKAKAEEFLATAKDEATFKSQIVELEKEAEKNKLTPKADETNSASAETTGKSDDDYLKNFIKNDQAYDEDSKSAKWADEEGRKAGDMTVLEVTKSYKGADGKTTEEVVGYQAVYLVEPTHLDETITKDVRHILFKADTYGSEDAAKAKAEEILAQYKAGEKTAEAFGELAKQYTDDANGDKGGLYENVAKDQMAKEFNDWLFDEKRQAGDVEIVKTSHGYHIMYYVGDGMAAWKVGAENSLKQEAYEKDIEALKKTYPVEYDNEALVIIP